MTTPLVQAIALAILNSDRRAGGWPAVESRDGIPDSEGYVRNAQAALTAITEAGYAVVPVEPDEAMTLIGDGERVARDDAAEIYRAMISATNTGKGGE